MGIDATTSGTNVSTEPVQQADGAQADADQSATANSTAVPPQADSGGRTEFTIPSTKEEIAQAIVKLKGEIEQTQAEIRDLQATVADPNVDGRDKIFAISDLFAATSELRLQNFQLRELENALNPNPKFRAVPL